MGRCTRSWVGERGSVAIEYLVVTILSLGLTAGMILYARRTIDQRLAEISDLLGERITLRDLLRF